MASASTSAAASSPESHELNGLTGGGGTQATSERPRLQRWLQGNGSININHYANKKSAAESMLDIALLMANASQLKAVMEQGPSLPFYIPLIVLISISLILQIGVGVLLIFLAQGVEGLCQHLEDSDFTGCDSIQISKI
ncbi:ninjurin-1 isoform X2 [Carettochelys insculpta]|uniref:ninjurin-1 isoform X2 n=1 Tax=Carettochelys insculpta TaxID=44489 RepID=UPI003EBCC158